MMTMPQTAPYVHYLDGRIRLHVPANKGAPASARALEALGRTLTGVSAHPITGHVVIQFAAEAIRPEAILEALRQAGYPPSAPQEGQPGHHLFHTVMQSAVECALEYLLLALV
jgi:hypothetical protein